MISPVDPYKDIRVPLTPLMAAALRAARTTKNGTLPIAVPGATRVALERRGFVVWALFTFSWVGNHEHTDGGWWPTPEGFAALEAYDKEREL